jgi:hypothetical protein
MKTIKAFLKIFLFGTLVAVTFEISIFSLTVLIKAQIELVKIFWNII